MTSFKVFLSRPRALFIYGRHPPSIRILSATTKNDIKSMALNTLQSLERFLDELEEYFTAVSIETTPVSNTQTQQQQQQDEHAKILMSILLEMRNVNTMMKMALQKVSENGITKSK